MICSGSPCLLAMPSLCLPACSAPANLALPTLQWRPLPNPRANTDSLGTCAVFAVCACLQCLPRRGQSGSLEVCKLAGVNRPRLRGCKLRVVKLTAARACAVPLLACVQRAWLATPAGPVLGLDLKLAGVHSCDQQWSHCLKPLPLQSSDILGVLQCAWLTRQPSRACPGPGAEAGWGAQVVPAALARS